MAAGGSIGMGRYKNPTKKDFMKWITGQRTQFNPVISTLTNQMNLLKPENSELVKQYQSVLGRIPGADQVSAAYSGKLADFGKALSGIDFAKGGAGVSNIVSGLAGAIGADAGAASDVAQSAGFVSGVGGQGGDVYSKALMGGAASKFAGLEADKLAADEANRQQMMLGIGEAKDKSTAQRMEIGRMLSETKGKKRASMLNPAEIASMLMDFDAKRQSFLGSNRSSGGGQYPQTPAPTSPVSGNSWFNRALGSVGSDLTAKEAEKLYKTGAYQSTMGLQGLIGGKKK